MVGELSALHIFVRGGDLRRGADQVAPASLGATFARDDKAGGYRVEHIYISDPDIPDELSPLAPSGVNVEREGDVIEAINGVPTLSARDIHALLRDQAGKQMLLKVKPQRRRRITRRRRHADHDGARERSALRRMGVHAAAGGREGDQQPDGIRPSARDGRRATWRSGSASSTRCSTAKG